MPVSPQEIYEFSDLRLDVSERLLMRKGTRLPVPDKAFEVLCVLVRNSGRLVGKNELLERVWGETVVEENNLDKSVSLLRNVLGERKGKQKFIETVRGHGYRFVYEAKRLDTRPPRSLTTVPENRSEPSPNVGHRVPSHPTHSHSTNVVALADWHPLEAPENVPVEIPATEVTKTSDHRRRSVYAVAAVLLLTVFATGSILFYFNYPSRITSIAVLPFVNASEDPNADYLSDGITENIINNLSRVPGLKVMSRSSAFHFKDDQNDTRRIASQMGVTGLITGDIRQLGDKLVVNVRLINAADNTQVWGEQYVRGSTDIIAIQNEIATDISRSLDARLSGEDTAFTKKSTTVPEAYQAYLKGRFYFEKFTPRDSRKALEYFQQATALDPEFAGAYAYTAGIYSGVAGAKDFPRAETVAKAKELALKSIVLDDQLAMGHEVYGVLVSRYDYNFAEGMQQLRRALELDPSDASARETYAGLLTNTGDHEQALREARLAEELNPLSPSVSSTLGNTLLFARRYGEAQTQFQKALELDPRSINAHYGMAIAYQMQQNFAASVEERAIVTDILGDGAGASFIRESFARGGWQEFVSQATTNEQAPQPPLYVKASLLAETGEYDKAFEILVGLCDENSSSVTLLKVDPRFDKLRPDPRFNELLKRINLI